MSNVTEFKVVDRFKESNHYLSMGGMNTRKIELATASQEDLKAIYDQEMAAAGLCVQVEKIEPAAKKGKE